MGEETGAEGKEENQRIAWDREGRGTLTQPGWQLLGPSTGGKEPQLGRNSSLLPSLEPWEGEGRSELGGED